MTTSTPAPPASVFLYGAGRVGTAVSFLLQRAGHPVLGVASPSPSSAERAAARLDVPVGDLRGAADAELVLIGAPDDALRDAASALAGHVARGSVVVHFAGAAGVEPLDAVRAGGAQRAALHPVQSCPDVDTGIRRLPGSAWGVTCDDGARATVTALIERSLDGRVVRVGEEDRLLWHSAAVVTANGLSALLSFGEDALGTIGVDHADAVLGPLARGSLDNALERGGGMTLTGPIVRGEVDVVASHRRALAERSSELARAYALVAAVILDAAQRGGHVDAATAARFREELERT